MNAETIKKLTHKYFKILYGKEVNVFFDDINSIGLFRAAETNQDNKPSITFSNYYIPAVDEKIIIHEITHFKVDVEYNPNTKRFRHPKEFYKIYNKNLRKIKEVLQNDN